MYVHMEHMNMCAYNIYSRCVLLNFFSPCKALHKNNFLQKLFSNFCVCDVLCYLQETSGVGQVRLLLLSRLCGDAG